MSVVELVSRLSTRDVSGLAVGEVRASLDEVARVQAWLDAVRVIHARALALEQLSVETPILRPAGQVVDDQPRRRPAIVNPILAIATGISTASCTNSTTAHGGHHGGDQAHHGPLRPRTGARLGQ